jgi:hypothetical protein
MIDGKPEGISHCDLYFSSGALNLAEVDELKYKWRKL